MNDKFSILQELVNLSRNLGLPENDYVILGDGNTSAKIDENTFWVKASGAYLHNILPESFVQMRIDRVLTLLEKKNISDDEILKMLSEAKVDQNQPRPSLETTFHALALTLGGAKFVGHTHPVALNSILCSIHAKDAFEGRIFSEEILYCGIAPAFVPYTDPGLPLAHAIKKTIQEFITQYGESPRVILLQNHGMIALGQTAAEVENITAMAVKAARILLGTYLLGGPHYLSNNDISRIYSRPDELYRRQKANLNQNDT
ncbi:MAG: class II aldolase/adducin family protein [Candidatus Kryptoniota bacterium]